MPRILCVVWCTNKRKATQVHLLGSTRRISRLGVTFGATARESLAEAPGASVLAFSMRPAKDVTRRAKAFMLFVYRGSKTESDNETQTNTLYVDGRVNALDKNAVFLAISVFREPMLCILCRQCI